jgi:hypothetical protein
MATRRQLTTNESGFTLIDEGRDYPYMTFDTLEEMDEWICCHGCRGDMDEFIVIKGKHEIFKIKETRNIQLIKKEEGE